MKQQVLWGAVQGTVEMPPVVLEAAKSLALEHFAQAEQEEFNGDLVASIAIPQWLPRVEDWFPDAVVHSLGYRRAPHDSDKVQLLATAGVDRHVDGIAGPTLILVLHNDGLTFVQGRQRHRTEAGQWFIFDDRLPHEVKCTTRTTSYLALSVPLTTVVG